MPATLDLMEAHAPHVTLERGKVQLELAAATLARQTRTLLGLAMIQQTAPATRAGLGLMEGHARRVAQASTRMYRELSAAAAAQQTRAHLSRAQL